MSRMATVVSMMEDFNKIGTIFQTGLINCTHDCAMDLDCIEIESLAWKYIYHHICIDKKKNFFLSINKHFEGSCELLRFNSIM